MNHENDDPKGSDYEPTNDVDKESFEEKIQNRRSWVRVAISILAMLFVFVGGSSMIVYLVWAADDFEHGINVFNIVFPVATGVIGYWFADQGGLNRGDPKR